MTGSEAFYKKAKDAIRRKTGRPDEEIAGDVRDVLFAFLTELPDNLKHDIFNFYFEKYLDDTTEGKTVYQLAEAPLAMIDFMNGELTTDEVVFSDEEWELIREGINANADTMDLRLLNQLMTILVEKKKY
ncbi:MAG: hypothetical protein WCG80_15325 [Spirochaetales bacterium]